MNTPGDYDDEPSSMAIASTPYIQESRRLLSSLFAESPGDYIIDGCSGGYNLRLARKHPQHPVDHPEYTIYITQTDSTMHLALNVDPDPQKNLYFDTEKGIKKEGSGDSRLPEFLRNFEKIASAK